MCIRDRVRVDMGEPELDPEKIPIIMKGYSDETDRVLNAQIKVDGKVYHMTGVSMGNPHDVVYIDDVQGLDIEKIGPKFENHERFPQRINTEFARVIDRKTVEMRVWERGSGETLACGTGACAVAVASILNGYTEREVEIRLLDVYKRQDCKCSTSVIISAIPALSSAPRMVVPSVVISVWPVRALRCSNISGLRIRPLLPRGRSLPL